MLQTSDRSSHHTVGKLDGTWPIRPLSLPIWPVIGGSRAAHRVDRLETPEDQALGVERNLAGNLETRVVLHFCFGRVEGRLVGPHLPGEDDLLAVLRVDGATEVGVFASGDVVLP